MGWHLTFPQDVQGLGSRGMIRPEGSRSPCEPAIPIWDGETSVGRKISVQTPGGPIDGEDLDFETLKESWNEYKTEDGSTIRMKTVVTNIVRLTGRFGPDGEPVYTVRSSNVVTTSSPPDLKLQPGPHTQDSKPN